MALDQRCVRTMLASWPAEEQRARRGIDHVEETTAAIWVCRRRAPRDRGNAGTLRSTWLLEYDDERIGIPAWVFVRRGKTVAPGLISTKVRAWDTAMPRGESTKHQSNVAIEIWP